MSPTTNILIDQQVKKMLFFGFKKSSFLKWFTHLHLLIVNVSMLRREETLVLWTVLKFHVKVNNRYSLLFGVGVNLIHLNIL